MNLLKKKSPWKVVIILAVSLILIELLYIAAIFNSGTVIVMKHYSDQYYVGDNNINSAKWQVILITAIFFTPLLCRNFGFDLHQ